MEAGVSRKEVAWHEGAPELGSRQVVKEEYVGLWSLGSVGRRRDGKTASEEHQQVVD